jgi:hypothetical protein
MCMCTAQDWNAANVFLAPCSGIGSYSSQLFSFDGGGGSPGQASASARGGLLSSLHLDFWRTGLVRHCIGTTTTPTWPDAGKPERHAQPALPLQLWVKPQPHGAVAILLLNMARGSESQSVTVDFAELNLTAASDAPTAEPAVRFAIRDVWQHADAGVASELTVEISGYDSRMYLLTPSTRGGS